MPNIPPGLRYSKEHEWVRLEGGVAFVGISDYAQSQLGDIVYLELPKAGAAVRSMQSCGTIESVKAASDLFSPLSGKVLAINQALAKSPELVNQDCYGAGWLVQIEPSNLKELDQLLDAAAYAELVASLK